MTRDLHILTVFFLLFPLSLSAQFEESEILYPFDFRNHLEIFSADMDGDGDADMVVAKSWDELGWYENLNGSHTPAYHRIDEDIYFKSMAIVDIDQDGDSDIVVSISSRTIWFENDGNGNFERHYINGQSYSSIYFVDMNEDSYPDMIAARPSNKTILWYENNQEGGFKESIVVYDLAKNTMDVEAADINQDGHLDIVAGLGWGGNRVIWFENLGMGVFGSPQTISTEVEEVSDIAIADMNGDGWKDVLSISTKDKKVAWYENKKNGFWGEQQIITECLMEGCENYKLHLMDVEQDGDWDVVTAIGGNFKMGIFANDGLGQFTSAYIGTGGNPYQGNTKILPIDWDTDGDLDLFGFNGRVLASGYDVNDNELNWRENKGGGSFSEPLFLAVGLNQVYHLKIADMDQNGWKDIILTTAFGRKLIYLKGEEGENSTPKFVHTVLIDEGLKEFSSLEIVDLDRDGDLDILGTLNRGRDIVWYENQGVGDFKPKKHIDTHPEISYPGATTLLEDMDKDGWVDFLYINSGKSELLWYRNNHEGGFDPPKIAASGVSATTKAFLYDLDKDSDLDLLLVSNEEKEAAWYKNDGTANFEWAEYITQDLQFPYTSQFFDVDGDGMKNLLTTHAWYKKGEQGYTSNIVGIDAQSLQLVEDINKDGNLDVLAYHAQYPNKGRWYLNDGQGRIGLQFVNTKAKTGSLSTLIDMNKDGWKDVLGLTIEGGGTRYLRWQRNIGNFSDFVKHYQLNGRQYIDTNENGTFDAGEDWGLQLQPLLLSPLSEQTHTYADGTFSFIIPSGAYVLNVPEDELWELSTDSASYSFHTKDQEWQLRNFDFGFKPKRILPRVEPYLNSNPNRCNETVKYWLDYINTGSTVASGTVQLKLDELMGNITVNPSPDFEEEGILYWYFENLLPTHKSRITLSIQMPNEESIGEWVETQARVELFNENEELVSVKTDDYSAEIRCSYDPNDKLVRSHHLQESNQVWIKDSLLYTIRFQNTGNDTAFNIVIQDTLSRYLDWQTFQPITSSHAMRTTASQSGVVRFYFDDILLPDSTTNEEQSHGFVMYSIAPLPDLHEGVPIHNTAAIYFDFNPPIITNTTENKIVHSLTTDIEDSLLDNGYSILVRPNPFSDYTTIEVSGLSVKGNYQLQVMDILGSKVRELKLEEGKANLERGELRNGLYLIQVLEEGSGEILGIGKVLVE